MSKAPPITPDEFAEQTIDTVLRALDDKGYLIIRKERVLLLDDDNVAKRLADALPNGAAYLAGGLADTSDNVSTNESARLWVADQIIARLRE